VSSDSGSTFLPFHDSNALFRNFALSTELLRIVISGAKLADALRFVEDNVLFAYEPRGLYLLEREGEAGEKWMVSEQNLSATTSGMRDETTFEVLQPSSQNEIARLTQIGQVGLATTSGLPLEYTAAKEEFDGESYRLLIIPLIYNLVSNSTLAVVISNKVAIASADIELFAMIQVLISYCANGLNAETN